MEILIDMDIKEIIKVFRRSITDYYKFDNVDFGLFLRERLALCMVKN